MIIWLTRVSDCSINPGTHKFYVPHDKISYIYENPAGSVSVVIDQIEIKVVESVDTILRQFPEE